MRGVVKGEESTTTKPLLQFYSRQGSYMSDIFEGSFVIEDVRNPDSAAATRIPSSTINTASVADGGDRLGAGRYAIRTGSTAAWSFGTHRVVVTYRLEDGGPEYQQEILFEIVSGSIYTSGRDYTGYAATRDLYRDGYFEISSAMTTPEKLHAHIRRESKRLEGLTQRFFEPRFYDYRVDGDGRSVLFLDEAIIAIEGAGTVQQAGSPPVDTISSYSNDGFYVHNRHLDGLLNPDDRDNPKLDTARDDIGGYVVRGWSWPSGSRNISVRGVFGFTDPSPDSNADGVSLGHTPDEFIQIIGVLIGRQLEDPGLTSPATWRPGRIKMYQTRDQQIQFYGASGNVNYAGGILGDDMLDQMLLRFVKPARLDFTERKDAWRV